MCPGQQVCRPELREPRSGRRGPTAISDRSVGEFERDLQFRPIGLYRAILDHEVLLDDLGDPKITQGFRRALDRAGGGLVPGIRVRADQLDDLVNAVSHGFSSLE